MTFTKDQLLEQNQKLREGARAANDSHFKLQDELKILRSELSALKNHLSMNEDELAIKNDAVNKMIKVLSGNASNNSKGEVLTDFFRVPVEEERLKLRRMLEDRLKGI